MIVTEQELERARACPEGIEFFRSLKIKEDDWTLTHQIWMATVAPGYYAWCVSRNILPMLSMAGADLRKISLMGAVFLGADFTGADLSGATLLACDFTGSSFDRADLTKCNLLGTTLLKCTFQKAILTSAMFDKDTEINTTDEPA